MWLKEKKRKEERNIEKEKPQIQKKKMKKIGWNPLDQLDKEIDTSESEEICAIAKIKKCKSPVLLSVLQHHLHHPDPEKNGLVSRQKLF